MADAKVYNEIREERGRQEKDGCDAGHDDAQGAGDWLQLIKEQLRGAEDINRVCDFGDTNHPHRDELLKTFRYQLIRTAAVAVAAVESIDRVEASDEGEEAG